MLCSTVLCRIRAKNVLHESLKKQAEELDTWSKQEAAVQSWYQQNKGHDTKGWMGLSEGYLVPNSGTCRAVCELFLRFLFFERCFEGDCLNAYS